MLSLCCSCVVVLFNALLTIKIWKEKNPCSLTSRKLILYAKGKLCSFCVFMILIYSNGITLSYWQRQTDFLYFSFLHWLLIDFFAENFRLKQKSILLNDLIRHTWLYSILNAIFVHCKRKCPKWMQIMQKKQHKFWKFGNSRPNCQSLKIRDRLKIGSRLG